MLSMFEVKEMYLEERTKEDNVYEDEWDFETPCLLFEGACLEERSEGVEREIALVTIAKPGKIKENWIADSGYSHAITGDKGKRSNIRGKRELLFLKKKKERKKKKGEPDACNC